MSPFVRDHGLLRGQGLPLGPYTLRYPAEERAMVRVLADRAADRPDKPWVIFDSTDVLTFGDAWRTVRRVGHALDRDVDAGAHVGVLMRNRPEFLTTFYGVQVRGGVTVPFNADARGPLLHAVVEHSDVQAIVAQADLLDRLDGLTDLAQVRVVVVVGEGEVPDAIHGVPVVRWEQWLEGVPDDHAWPFPAHDALAHIQFTSGTTARAKGAMYPHSFLFLYSSLTCDSQERHEDDVLTAPLPLFHVAALHIIANSCLHVGCTGHLKSRFSASQYWQQCAEDGATWGQLLGPMAAMIQKATPDPVPEHGVTRVYCPPPPPDVPGFEQRFEPVKVIWWGYGMTEILPMPMIDPALQRPGMTMDTIGMPAEWTDYGVVDDHDELLPPDAVGELVFRPRFPHAMASGYYKDAARTAEVFRNFMFHTGDLASYDEDGLLHYRGRRQERIRVRGENIAAPELEFVALKHPSVMDAAAYAVPSDLGEDEVKLDVVLREAVTVDELHAWLAANVPRYMVPRYLEVRESFPKTPSERVEKYKLQDQPLDRPEVFDAAAAGRSR